MRASVSYLTILLFFIWILPLGVFIKPAQEEITCGGKRAVCLCSHLIEKQQAKSNNKIVLKAQTSSSNERINQRTSPDYLFSSLVNNNAHQISSYNKEEILSHVNPFTKLIEHVPRA